MIDEKDKLILNELQRNCRQSMRQLSRKLNLPATTIYQRIKKLEALGVIKYYTAILDPIKVGLPTTAIVLIEAVHHIKRNSKISQVDILNKAVKIVDANEAFMMTGGYDMLLKVRGENERDIGRRVINLRDIIGIGKTFTSMVIYTANDSPRINLK